MSLLHTFQGPLAILSFIKKKVDRHSMVPTNTPFTRALTAPHELIDELSRDSATTDLPAAVAKAFADAFPDAEAKAKIPYLTTENATQLVGKTVRWIGMVQDNSVSVEEGDV